jgi:hypothetical protein
MDDYQRLGVGQSASVVSALELLHWGGEVVVHCLYDPHVRRPYTLHFKNCKDVRLQPIEKGVGDSSGTSLIGIALGKEGHQKPAIVTTEAFELSVLYEEWDLRWT